MVAQYSPSATFDGQADADPFMSIVPPTAQFLNNYTIATAPNTYFTDYEAYAFTDYINIVAPAADVGSVTVDGTAVAASSFTAIGSSGYSGRRFRLALVCILLPLRYLSGSLSTDTPRMTATAFLPG